MSNLTAQKLLYLSTGNNEITNEFIDGKPACKLCGFFSGVVAEKEMFSGNFTNWDLCRNSQSNYVCEYCANILKDQIYRRSSWIATPNKFVELAREKIHEQIFDPNKQTPFCFYVTTSFKKLGQLKVKLNYNPSKFFVLFEETQVLVDLDAVKNLWDTMRLFYSIAIEEETKTQPKSFFTKEEMRTGNYDFKRIKTFGMSDFFQHEKEIARFRNNQPSVLEFLLHILNQERLKRCKIV